MFPSPSSCALRCLFLLGTVAAAAIHGRDGDLTTVTTAQGPVQGSYNATSGVYRYLAIPYGDDTSGANRFMPPKPAPNRTGVLDATTFGPSCIQLIDAGARSDMSYTGNQYNLSGQSERCLNVNIWVNQATRSAASDVANGAKTGAPVLLFMHGGSYIWGATSSPLLDANRFAANQEDLVVITFDYRLSIFGHPRAPQLQTAPGGWNVGLLDRDAVVSWVYDNVAAFGGDRNRITLWGQSSGGASADLWAFSHANGEAGSNKVAGLIIESGAVTSLSPFIALTSTPGSTDPVGTWDKIATNVSCGAKPTTDAQRAAQLQCMQAVPSDVLLAATAAQGSIFTPQADNQTFFDDLSLRSTAGRVARVPILIGSNAHESTIMGASNPNDSVTPILADTLVTPLCFTCGASTEAADRIAHGIPAFRYQYAGNWADVNSGRTELQAFHGSELSLLFGTYGPSPVGNWGNTTVGPRTVPVPAAEDATSAFLQGMWASFARDPANGLPSRGWPKYNPLGPTLARIALNNDPNPHYTFPGVLEVACDLGIPQVRAVLQQLASIGGKFFL